jgi:hypothetical protein
MNQLIQAAVNRCPVTYHEEYTDPFTNKLLKHVYTLNKNLKLAPGVSSIGANNAKDFLPFWYAKETVTFLGYFDPTKTPKEQGMARLIECHKAVKAMTAEAYLKHLEQAKGAAPRKAKEATNHGELAHYWCNLYIKARLGEIDVPNYQALTPEAQSSVRAFLAWEEAHDVHWLSGDIVIGSEVHEYGGRPDGLCSIDGIPTLVDFKTSNQISEDYFIQTAGYHIALKEMGLDMWQRLILRVPKDGKDFEALIVPTPLDLDCEAFLALRQVQRWKSYIENTANGVKDTAGKVLVPPYRKHFAPHNEKAATKSTKNAA